MTRQFVRHVHNAHDHLQSAVAALQAGDFNEVIVSLRCVLVEVECAKARPVAGVAERSVLREIETAAIQGEMLLRRALRPEGSDEPPP